jgi:hypothetical protein
MFAATWSMAIPLGKGLFFKMMTIVNNFYFSSDFNDFDVGLSVDGGISLSFVRDIDISGDAQPHVHAISARELLISGDSDPHATTIAA